jgi:PRC-barrel domain
VAVLIAALSGSALSAAPQQPQAAGARRAQDATRVPILAAADIVNRPVVDLHGHDVGRVGRSRHGYPDGVAAAGRAIPPSPNAENQAANGAVNATNGTTGNGGSSNPTTMPMRNQRTAWPFPAPTSLRASCGCRRCCRSDSAPADVYAVNGDPMGHIDQAMTDTRHGHVAYVLVQRGGFLGLHPTRYALPIEALKWSRATGARLAMAESTTAPAVGSPSRRRN